MSWYGSLRLGVESKRDSSFPQINVYIIRFTKVTTSSQTEDRVDGPFRLSQIVFVHNTLDVSYLVTKLDRTPVSGVEEKSKSRLVHPLFRFEG